MQQKTNVCGIISLTLGIIGVLATCTCYGWLIAIPGIILGLIGICLPGYKKGIAIAGLIVSISAFALFVIIYVGVEMLSEIDLDSY